MPTQDTIYKNLDTIHNSPNVIDTLVEIDRVLDRMDVYAYENWISGEIVDGPFVERHWVEMTLMYPKKMMPNPDAAMRLIKNGCKVKFGEDTLTTFTKVKGPEDIITTKDGQKVPKPIEKKVWLVNLRIPKALLNVSEDIKDTDDVDQDSIESAYDEELDGTQGLQDQNDQQPAEQAPTQELPPDEQGPQIQA
jgi:hypothetical protein